MLVEIRNTGSERGASLVLVSMVIVVIIGMVGLAIDLNIGLSASTDQQEVSNALATAALEAFLSDNSSDQNQRLNSAVQRVRELARLPQNRAVFQSFMDDPNAEMRFCVKANVSDACSNDDQGAIVPGLHIPEANALHTCPGDKYPCFLPGLPAGEEATAFQVELRQTGSAPIRTLFAKAFGIKSLRTHASSTAAVVPRQVVFAVDLSSSVEGTSHNKNGGPNQRRASAYKLVPSISCNSDHTVSTDPCGAAYGGSACNGIVSGSLGGFDSYNIMWSNTLTAPPGGVRAPNTPYKSDYQCWHVNDDGNGPANYLIDLPNGQYTAEPLSSILRAIDQALVTFRQRRNAGDRVQIQFFDTNVLRNREVPFLPDAPAAFSLASIDESDANYQEIKAITSGDLEARITRHAIFPRVNPLTRLPVRNPRQDPEGGVFSNVSYSAYRAYDALTRNANVFARRNVVVFSDFIANCWDHVADPFCSNEGPVVLDALYHLVDRVVGDNYRDNDVAFNPIVFGDYVAPHTTLPLGGGQTGCMWNGDDIRTNILGPVVNGYGNVHSYVNVWSGLDRQDFPPDPSQGTYYFQANLVYGAALETGGEWGVIRPCCKNSSGVCADVRPALDLACNQVEDDLLGNTFESGWGCPRGPTPDQCKAGFAWKYNWIDDPVTRTYLDPNGRLICDPQGRNQAQQMQDYMTKILGSNSIVLVETKQNFGG